MVTLNTEKITQDIDPKKARVKEKKAIKKVTEALEVLEVIKVPVVDLQPNLWNPNRQSDHDFELLMRSIEEDGFTQPVVVVKSNPGSPVPYTIVDGEHRWRAVQKLGWDYVYITVAPFSEEQAKIATLRHNRARGSEDLELSAELLKDLRQLGALDWAQDALMLDDIELERLLDETPVSELLAGDGYSEAWEPAESPGDAPAKLRVDGNRTEGMTAAAIEALNAQNQKLKDAKTAEERQIAQKDAADIYRLSLVFHGDEATVVKRALSSDPATIMLQLCRNHLEAND